MSVKNLLTDLLAATNSQEGVVIQRSSRYDGAVVVGVSDKPGSLLISYASWEPEPEFGVTSNGYWVVRENDTLTPKELEDGIVRIDEQYVTSIHTWEDMERYINHWCESLHEL